MQFSFAVLLFPKMKTRREKKEKKEEWEASNWQRILVAEWRRIPARELRLPLIKPLECSTRRCKLSKGSNKKALVRVERGEDEGESDFVFDDVCSSLLAHVLCAASVCFALNKRIQFVNLYRIKHESLPPLPPLLVLLLLRH